MHMHTHIHTHTHTETHTCTHMHTHAHPHAHTWAYTCSIHMHTHTPSCGKHCKASSLGQAVLRGSPTAERGRDSQCYSVHPQLPASAWSSCSNMPSQSTYCYLQWWIYWRTWHLSVGRKSTSSVAVFQTECEYGWEPRRDCPFLSY